jgi:hypothetical protein
MTRRRQAGTSLQLKPADPFELIRWLARSQSDPRKAVAELVQNSLDAGAHRVTVRRQRIKGALCLLVRDDGEGVLPDLGREEALRYLATHVGHSRKLGLDPAERAQRVVAGKYGVGLLGFWSIGRFLELRSRVAGSGVFALHLAEDSHQAKIFELPRRFDSRDTFTEAAVLEVHPAAQRALGGRRLAEYLAAELRGQLLRRDVEVIVQDDVARGLAQKTFPVSPRRFSGERLSLPTEVPVPEFAPVRVELYLARGTERPAIQVACAGTLVAEDIVSLDALGLSQAPWLGRDLTGMVDFASFNVPPGTRRGVMPDKAALAFVEAMDRLAPLVMAELARLDDERQAARDRDIVRELRRALRGFQRRLPQYSLPEVAERASVPGPLPGGAPLSDPEPRSQEGAHELHLFPIGALERVRIVPSRVRVTAGSERRARAVATDAENRPIADAVFAWEAVDVAGMGLVANAERERVALTVPPEAPVGAHAELRVEARCEDRTVIATAIVEVVADDGSDASLGIPEPQLVSDSDGTWRSRMVGQRWDVNEAHEDYRALRADPRSRVRYLLALLAKEIVLRTTGRPETADALESLVEVLAHTERNLRGA